MLPEYIINEELDDCSEDSSVNSEDDESDNIENCLNDDVPKGSLQGSVYFCRFTLTLY